MTLMSLRSESPSKIQAFEGSADIYVGTGGLLEAASTLEGFPEDHSDKRELVLGAAGKKFAGGSVRLELPTTRKNR